MYQDGIAGPWAEEINKGIGIEYWISSKALSHNASLRRTFELDAITIFYQGV